MGFFYFCYDEWHHKGILYWGEDDTNKDKLLVQDLMSDNKWDWNKLTEHVPTQLATNIFLNYELSVHNEVVPLWKKTSNGTFCTKSAWEMVRTRNPSNKMLFFFFAGRRDFLLL